MNQAQLERAVCRATGESRKFVRRLGFQEMPIPKIVLPRHGQPATHVKGHTLTMTGK